MKLRALRLHSFRRFQEPMAVERIADGLNRLAGPNELGKSTLFHALESLFMVRHSVSGAVLNAMRPHAGGEPLVEADFEIDGRSLRLRKQFGRGSSAVLSDRADGRTLARNADAEDLLLRLTNRTGDHAGGLGLVWVRQQRALQSPAPDLAADGKPRDRGERSALVEAIASEVGGATGGPMFEAVRDMTRAAVGELLTDTRKALRKNGPLFRLHEDRERIKSELAEARRAADTSEARLRRIADLSIRQAGLSDPQARAEDLRRATELDAQLNEARLRLARLQPLQDAVTARAAELAAAEQAAASTAQLAAMLEEKRRAVDAAGRLAEEIATLKAALAADPMTPTARDDLVALDHEYRLLVAQLAGRAATIDVALLPQGTGKVRIDGRVIEPDAHIEAPRSVAIEIDGIGQIRVAPADAHQGAVLVQRREAAERGLAARLTELGVASLDEARERAAARQDRVDNLERARAALSAMAPRGFSELSAGVEGLAARWQAMAAAAPGQNDLARLRLALAAARQALDDARLTCPTSEHVAELAAAAEHARTKCSARTAELARIDVDLANAKGEQAGADEDGKAAEIEGLQGALGAVEAQYAALEREARALHHLEKTLDAIEAEAKTEIFGPLTRRLAPHLTELFGGASLRFAGDFAPASLRRANADEPFAVLSDGTREQLNVLVRLAYAELLADQGRAVPLVLDDPFVYSDDARLAKLCAVLARPTNVQTLLLTCRPSAFASLAANDLAIEPWRDEKAVGK